MSTSDSSSEITLLEASGLIKDLFEKLTGNRWRIWLRGFKKFLRKENPWIRTDEISRGIHSGKPDIEHARHAAINSCSFLRDFNIKIWKCFREFLDDPEAFKKVAVTKQEELFYLKSYSHVAVRLGDLLSAKDIGKVGYEKILEIAQEEHGLYPCAMYYGIADLGDIATRHAAMNRNDPLDSYILCTEIIEQDGAQKLPAMWIRINGDCGEEDRGILTLMDIRLPKKPSAQPDYGTLCHPETRLIFRTLED